MFSVPVPLLTAGSPGAMAPPVTVTDWRNRPVPPRVPPVTATFPVPVPEPLVLFTEQRASAGDGRIRSDSWVQAVAVRISVIKSDNAARHADEARDEAAAAVYDHVVDDGRRVTSTPLNVSVYEPLSRST